MYFLLLKDCRFDGAKLRALRKERGLTQVELASSTRKQARQITHWETGRADPSAKSMWDLTVALDCKVEDLLSEAVGIR